MPTSCAALISDRFVPSRIRRVANHAAVLIRGAIAPPDRSALSERDLCLIHRSTCRGAMLDRCLAFELATRVHQCGGQTCFLRGRQWVRRTPQTTANNDVASVRRAQRMRCHGFGIGRGNDGQRRKSSSALPDSTQPTASVASTRDRTQFRSPRGCDTKVGCQRAVP